MIFLGPARFRISCGRKILVLKTAWFTCSYCIWKGCYMFFSQKSRSMLFDFHLYFIKTWFLHCSYCYIKLRAWTTSLSLHDHWISKDLNSRNLKIPYSVNCWSWKCRIKTAEDRWILCCYSCTPYQFAIFGWFYDFFPPETCSYQAIFLLWLVLCNLNEMNFNLSKVLGKKGTYISTNMDLCYFYYNLTLHPSSWMLFKANTFLFVKQWFASLNGTYQP